MPNPETPAIPRALADQPLLGGLVVPWISARAGGRFLLGAIDADRTRRALLERRCGVCGRPLGDRLVLLARESDLRRQRVSEPALHPVCAAYTMDACPMIAGRLEHYRSSPVPLAPGMVRAPDSALRTGADAEAWYAVWLRRYTIVVDHGGLAASYAGDTPLRIRLVGRRPPAGDTQPNRDPTPADTAGAG
jgi:hypothetical protein